MDQDFRIQAIEQLAKMAGLITDTVKEQLEKGSEHKFGPAGISLGYPGTAVIWPGESAIHPDGSVNIMFFFRGGSAGVMNQSATNAIVVTADAGGAGGGPSEQAYGRADFVNRVVASILAQLKKKLGRDVKLGKLGLAGWSGGYAPIHSILTQSGSLVKQPDYVGIFDGMHHGAKGKPNEKAMEPYLDVAQNAAKGGTEFVVTHSAVDPGSYASSTDTANWLVQQMQMQRQPVPDWAGQGVHPASVAQSGNFKVVQLYDQAQPYQVKDPTTGKVKPDVPGTSGYQHIQAIRSAPDYLPNWS